MPANSLRTARNALHTEIQTSHRLLQTWQVRPGCRLLDLTLARYVWGALSSAALVLEGQNASRASAPLLRYLIETLMDVHFILTSARPEKAVVRTIVWDVLEWDRQCGLIREVAAAYHEKETPQAEKPDDVIRRICQELRAAGEPWKKLDAQYKSTRRKKTRHWHWSGMSRWRMMQELLRREGSDREATQLVSMYRRMWVNLSGRAHPLPRWGTVSFELHANGRITFPHPSRQDKASVVGVTNSTRRYLKMLRQLIEEFYRRENENARN